MVTHVVIFDWIAGVSDHQLHALSKAFDDLATTLENAVTLRHGADLRFREGNGDYALVATFPDRAGWDAYQADPRHQAVVRDFVAPILAARRTIQF